jgi:hypothetical protein
LLKSKNFILTLKYTKHIYKIFLLQNTKILILRKVYALITFVLLHIINPIIKIAFIKIKELVNAYNFKISTYTNKFKYIYKERDYKLITCKYLFSYMPPLA